MTDPEQGSPPSEVPETPETPETPEAPDGPGRRALRPPGARRRVATPTVDEQASRAERRAGGLAARVRALLPERLERPTATTLLAVGLPVVTLLVGVLADARVDDGLGAHAPSTAALVRTSQICPVSPSAGGRVLVASDTEAGGRVAVRSAGVGVRSTPLTVRPQRVAERSAGSRPTIVTGEDAVAPGLQVTGVSGGRLAAASCPTPSADVWFTGVGADATHRSILELTNPDAGRAVVSIEALGSAGDVDAPRLRGLAVPGRGTVRIDLAEQVPTRGGLALHVTTDRGRVSASVLDRIVPLGSGATIRELLPAQQDPERTLTLMGLAPGASERTLTVANPTQDAVRVRLRLATPQSVLTPSKATEIVLDPRSIETVDLDRVLGDATAEDALGLVLTGTGPITATLRARAGGDLVETVPAPAVADRTLLAVPQASGRIVIAGATGVGEATVRAWDARGRQVLARAVDLRPGRGTSLGLPSSARLVALDPERTTVRAALVLTRSGSRGGAVVLPLEELVRKALVPDVRPALP